MWHVVFQCYFMGCFLITFRGVVSCLHTVFGGLPLRQSIPPCLNFLLVQQEVLSLEYDVMLNWHQDVQLLPWTQWHMRDVVVVLQVDFWNLFWMIALIDILCSSCEIECHMGDKWTLVQVMAWCCQAASHYLSVKRSMWPYSITRP